MMVGEDLRVSAMIGAGFTVPCDRTFPDRQCLPRPAPYAVQRGRRRAARPSRCGEICFRGAGSQRTDQASAASAPLPIFSSAVAWRICIGDRRAHRDRTARGSPLPMPRRRVDDEQRKIEGQPRALETIIHDDEIGPFGLTSRAAHHRRGGGKRRSAPRGPAAAARRQRQRALMVMRASTTVGHIKRAAIATAQEARLQAPWPWRPAQASIAVGVLPAPPTVKLPMQMIGNENGSAARMRPCDRPAIRP